MGSDLGEIGNLGLAAGAAGQMLFKGRPLVRFQGIDGEKRSQFVERVAVELFVHRRPPSADLRLFKPSRIRALAVPSGMSSCRATSW